MEDYEIREARENEKPQLDWLVRDHFNPNEFMTRTFLEVNGEMIDSESLRLFWEQLLERRMKTMARNPCLVAVHRASRRVVGFCALDHLENPKFVQEKSSTSHSPISYDVTNTWLRRFIDLFAKYAAFEVHPEVPNSLEIKAVCVIEEHRRRGLAEGLIKAAVDLARAKNLAMVESLFTSPHTIRIAEKLGFLSYADDDLAAMRDSHGNLAFPGIKSYVISAMTMKLE